MFLGVIMLGLIMIFFYLWGDYMKVLIFIEILRLVFIRVLLYFLKIDFVSLNYFLICLVFLVCESSIGFFLFIFYIRIEYEVVKKINLIQF